MMEPPFIRRLRNWMGIDADMRHSKTVQYITPADAWDVLKYVDALNEKINGLEREIIELEGKLTMEADSV